MMYRRLLEVAAGGALALLVLASTAVGSSVTPAARTLAGPGWVDRFWSPERIAQAQPLRPPRPSPEAVDPAAARLTAVEAGGSAESIPPSSPVRLLSADAAVADPTAYPNRLNGKLLYTTADGHLGSCTASVVSAPGKSLLFTAGHCVYNVEYGGWNLNVAFVPAYAAGNAPYGVWPAALLSVPQEWIASGGENLTYDLATIDVFPNAAGLSIQEVLGGWGVLFGGSPDQYHQVIGYPASPAPYDGEAMVDCDTNFLGYEARWTGAGDGVIGVGPCAQGHGASGGPFVTGDGLIQAVFSHLLCSEATGECDSTSFGTYFGAAARGLYDQTAGVAPSRPAASSAGVGATTPLKARARKPNPAWCGRARRHLLRRSQKTASLRRLAFNYRRHCRRA